MATYKRCDRAIGILAAFTKHRNHVYISTAAFNISRLVSSTKEVRKDV